LPKRKWLFKSRQSQALFVMGNFMKAALITSLLLFFLNGQAQIFNIDPFEIDNLDYYNVLLSKTEVLTNKVKRVSLVTYGLKKNGTRKKKGFLNYYIEYNKQGNPTHYYSKTVLPCWWWPNLLQNLHLQKESNIVYHCYFQYDTLQNLIHISDKQVESYSTTSYEKDIYYHYVNNSLFSQTIYQKTISKLNSKHSSESFSYDTSFTKYYFYYKGNNLVSNVYKCLYNYPINEITVKCDSIVFNCPFDSIFINKNLPKDTKLDSLGRIIETISHSTHALTIDGYCISPDSPFDIIIKYFYNGNGKIIKSELSTRKGDFVSRHFFNYDAHGLPLCNQHENLSVIECFEYEYY